MILASHGIIASSISGVDADWLAYYNRVIAAGGSLTTTEQNATKTLVADLKANSLWTPMKAIYPMVGASAAACAQNLKSSSFTGTFTSGWTFASTGVTPNGSSAYMDTNFVQTIFSQTNGEIGVYSRTNSKGSFNDIGVYQGAADWCLFPYIGLTNSPYGRASTSDINIPAYNPLTSLGLFSINANGTNTQKFYRDGILRGTVNAISATPMDLLNIIIGAANGVPVKFYSARQLALAYMSDTLNATQSSDFYTAVQAFQTTLSRQV
jgi:hypothetical protein